LWKVAPGLGLPCQLLDPVNVPGNPSRDGPHAHSGYSQTVHQSHPMLMVRGAGDPRVGVYAPVPHHSSTAQLLCL